MLNWVDFLRSEHRLTPDLASALSDCRAISLMVAAMGILSEALS